LVDHGMTTINVIKLDLIKLPVPHSLSASTLQSIQKATLTSHNSP
jgi:hypothetical protein